MRQRTSALQNSWRSWKNCKDTGVHAALQTVSQELAGVEEQYPATEAATGGDDGNFENDNSIAVTDPYQ